MLVGFRYSSESMWSKIMGDNATTCVFYEQGGRDLGMFYMYNPPIEGDTVSFGDGDDYIVVKRVFDVQDAKVRITVTRSDSA